MKIQKNISLKNKNWFSTGGKTKYFCKPTNENEFKKSLQFAKQNKLKIFVLGKGANILISDEGFDGITIKPELNKIKIKNNIIEAGSGVNIQQLIDHCLENNLIGLEEFSNIPGTIGGAVYINIHYIDHFLSDFLIKAKIINKNSGEIIDVDKNWFNFGYDQSKLQNKDFFLISATFKLKLVNNIKSEYAKGRRDEIIRHRQRSYPTKNTCGSFFRNFYKNEINFKINDKKILSVAYYLDKVGIKGELKVGNAMVSSKHANMIETLKNATSEDVINLAKKMQVLVYKKYKIIPKSECVFIGFVKKPI